MSLCDHIQILRNGKLVYSSLDKKQSSGALYEALPKYFVDISGVTPADVEALRAAHKLDPWQTLHQDGFLVQLGFKDYPSATSWLAPSLAKGYVIVRFGDDNSASEEQLLIHFKEEFTQ